MEINEQTISSLQDVYEYCITTNHLSYSDCAKCFECKFYNFASDTCTVGHPFSWGIKFIENIDLR